jgi:hypothetical protein
LGFSERRMKSGGRKLKVVGEQRMMVKIVNVE